ncbi:hypothetical protein [Serpentinicella alkaliphila]|uniref:Uncharacterized protein n=1 Tax=Serpentinicella alkaliphila TaxID=1734049 RepID=A0A4R2ST71_9FIRM|nr:hypothetical protein [Serpentinicella alkaliphila]QUH26152.1 hypothetical protein HZR23_10675 [Serpentinicella alkaliphila]TCP93549.1 hypothetical protein EDD79_10754 [Serpentinicella alkaliphila]
MSLKRLLDIEGQNGVPGYSVQLFSNELEIEIVLAGKNIILIPEDERNLNIYKLFENNCDLFFCTTQKLDDFKFYPVPSFWIFAVDSIGNCFGTIGGAGSITDHEYPVGYVSKKGTHGKISNSLKEFLELVTFYPYWRDIIKYEQMEISYDLRGMEKRMEKNAHYLDSQQEIARILKLTRNPKSVELLKTNISYTSEFEVYCSKKEAQKLYKFCDISFKDVTSGKFEVSDSR